MKRFWWLFLLVSFLFAEDLLDDQYHTVKRNFVTGINTRGHPTLIEPYQVVTLTNADLTEMGRTKKRSGFITAANDVSDKQFTNLARFNPSGGTDVILGVEGTNLRHWQGSGNWSAAIKSDLTESDYTMILVGNDEALISNGTDNVHSVNYAFGVTDELNTNADPPKGIVGAWFKDRYFIAKDGLIYFSDVASKTFDRSTNFFRVSVGDNDEITNLVPFRNDELIIFKEHSIWNLYCPTNTTPLTNWWLRPVDAIHGCVSKDAALQVGDDIYFWAEDGMRTLRRNEQDKVMGINIPASDAIYNTHIDGLNFQKKGLIRATYYKNQVIFGVPYGGAANYINKWYVYFIHDDIRSNGFSTWTPLNTGAFVKFPIQGEELLYFSDGAANGQLYKMFDGTNDNGSAITFELKSRIENLNDQGLELTKKFSPSIFLQFETSENSEVLVEAQVDEGGWSTIGTVDLDSNAPTLDVDLNFILTNSNIVIAKYPLDSFEHWYNIQLRFTQDTLDETLTILEWVLILLVDNYEFN